MSRVARGLGQGRPLETALLLAGTVVVKVRPWVERLARFGFAAKGFVYLLIGMLALRAATGTGGKITDPTGALRTMAGQPFGKLLLAALAAGLGGYALWRLVQAVLAPGERKKGAKAIVHRVAYGVSAGIYGFLGSTAAELVGGVDEEDAMETDRAIQQFMAHPLGPWVIGLAGVVFLAVAGFFLYRAYAADFQEEFREREMSDSEKGWACLVGRIGYAARGVVFGLVGYFLLQAARHVDARQVRDIGEVLDTLAHQPFGSWLLGAVAVGLIAHALHMFVAARYRRVWA